MATVQQIYIAIFGRPADPVGLSYWNEQTNNGQDLSAMIAAFTAAPEYQERFEGQSNEEIISSIYQSLFGREPDAEGLEFYADALANGELPIETIAVRILDGAQNEDQTTIDNKTEAANLFTEALDTPEEINGYVGEDAANEAADFLSNVNEDPDSVPTEDEIDEIIEHVNSNTYPDPEPETPDEGAPPGGGGGGTPTPEPEPLSVELRDESGVSVGTFQSLQAAIDAADEEFSIVVTGDGSFSEDLEIGLEGLTISGSGQTIDGGVHFLSDATRATLEGFSVTGTLPNEGSSDSSSIFVRSSSVTIRNVDIANESSGDIGISNTHDVTGLSIVGGSISGFGRYGTYLNTPEDFSVTGVTFEDNRYAVFFQDGNTPEISGNTFTGSDIADIGVWALRNQETEGNGPNLSTISGNTHNGSADDVRILSSNGHSVVGTSGADVFVELARGDDVFDGGPGADTMTGGQEHNTLISSSGGDTYIASEDEDGIQFRLSDTAHSGYGDGSDVTTFDFSKVEAGGDARIPLNILLSGDDFVGAVGRLVVDPEAGAFGIGRGEGQSAEDFFFLGEGEEVAPTPDVEYDPEVGDQSLVVYERLDGGEDHYMVYFDANGNGDLDAGDAQIEIIGLNHADVSWASGTPD